MVREAESVLVKSYFFGKAAIVLAITNTKCTRRARGSAHAGSANIASKKQCVLLVKTQVR